MKKIVQIESAQIQGLELQRIVIEGSKCRGLKQLHLIGLADSWLRESREKLSEIIQKHESWSPVERLLIHLMPPEISKNGAHLEVPIALACLCLCRQEELHSESLDFIKNHIFVGALSLNGDMVSTPVSKLVESMNPKALGPQTFQNIEQLWQSVQHPQDYQSSLEHSKKHSDFGLSPTRAVKKRHWERLLLLAASLSRTPTLLLGPP